MSRVRPAGEDRELEALRAEYEREGIGSRLYALINEIVGMTARRYPPAVYGPEGDASWNPESLSAVAHEWTLTTLLNPEARRLERILDEAANTGHLRARLTVSCKDHLADLGPDASRRIRKRLLRLLRDGNEFTCVSGRPNHDSSVWSLGPADRPPATRDGARPCAEEVPNDELDLREDHGPEVRESPILLDRGLRHLALRMLELTGGVGTGGDLAAAACGRLQLPDPMQLPVRMDDERWWSEPEDPRGSDDLRLTESELWGAADQVLEETPAQERGDLRAYLTHGEVGQAAARCRGRARKSIERSRRALRNAVAKHGEDEATAIAIHQRVVTLIEKQEPPCHP